MMIPSNNEADLAEQVLNARGVSKRFPGILALDNVDFDLRAGEIHGLVGENGAGKSTLMKLLSGNYIPDSGEIHVRGTPVSFKTPHDARGKGVLLVHQEIALAQNMTVAENLFLGSMPRRHGLVDWRTLHRRASQILDRFECSAASTATVSTLSIAQQQLVEICRSEAFDSKVVILDEPTASLSNTEAEALFRNIRRLRQNGCSIIYISHRMDEIFHLTDRITVLRDGKKRGTLKTTETDTDAVTKAMIGREITNYFPKKTSAHGATVLDVSSLFNASFPSGISLKVAAGEILGLYGLVGAGRTEFAETIFGVRKALGGDVRIAGETTRIKTPKDAMAAGIALAPEDRKRQGLALGLGIVANMVLPMQASYSRGGLVDSRKELGTYSTFKSKFRIAAAEATQPVGQLSGGNQQKVVLSKSLNCNPRLLILDEPARGVDVGAKVEIYRIIRELADEGMAVLMISSEMQEVIGLCDRVMTIYHGRVSGTFSGDQVTEDNLVRGATGLMAAAS